MVIILHCEGAALLHLLQLFLLLPHYLLDLVYDCWLIHWAPTRLISLAWLLTRWRKWLQTRQGHKSRLLICVQRVVHLHVRWSLLCLLLLLVLLDCQRVESVLYLSMRDGASNLPSLSLRLCLLQTVRLKHIFCVYLGLARLKVLLWPECLVTVLLHIKLFLNLHSGTQNHSDLLEFMTLLWS